MMNPVLLALFSAPKPLFELPTLSSITIPFVNVSLSTYPLMIAVGALGMLVCVMLRRHRFSLNTLQCIIFTLLLTVCGIAGAKLLFVLENLRDAFSGNLSSGGVSFFGSVYLIPLVMPLIGKLFGLTPSKTNDLCAPCIAVMVGFIRIGCMFNGCCGGRVAYVGDFYFSWPTQIMECIGDFLIFVWLLNLEKKEQKHAALYPLFMMAYSVMRFFIEFLRYSPSTHLGLSNGHWFALAAIFISVFWLNHSKRGQKMSSNQ